MIISPSRKILFIHLHKCGGTSVETAYEKIALWDDLIVGSTKFGEMLQQHYNKNFGLHKHSTAAGVIESIGQERYLELDAYALVRNPFRVYESLYSWTDRNFTRLARNRDTKKMKAQLRDGKIKQRFANWPVYRAYAHSDEFSEFMAYLVRRKNKLIKSFSDSLLLDDPVQAVKSVYRLEDMDDFWSDFEDRVDVKMERLHENRTVSRDYDWNTSDIDYVSKVHQRDLERFGYSF